MQDQLGQEEVWALGQGCKLEQRLYRNALAKGHGQSDGGLEHGFLVCLHSYSAAERRHVAFHNVEQK